MLSFRRHIKHSPKELPTYAHHGDGWWGILYGEPSQFSYCHAPSLYMVGGNIESTWGFGHLAYIVKMVYIYFSCFAPIGINP